MRPFQKRDLLPPEFFITCSGSKLKKEFSSIIDKKGRVVLHESGSYDIQQMIDAQVPYTDLSVILARVRQGDSSVLHAREVSYGDFTSLPKSFAEVMQLYINAEKDFSNLPVEVRNSFGNNFRSWLASAGSEEWLTKMHISPAAGTEAGADPDVGSV